MSDVGGGEGGESGEEKKETYHVVVGTSWDRVW